jgi:hypothetical protein
MTTGHLIALAGIIALCGGASVAPAQPAATPEFLKPVFALPSFLAPKAAKPPASKPSDPAPIAFFVATAPANACGPGCGGWIAADGRIDLHAAQRLRKVLAKLGPRKLPLFLNSAGGSVLGAIELGRLVRSYNVEVSVARTIPAACPHDQQPEKTCETLKRSGQVLLSEFDASGGMCNSACVLVLAGGAQRSVPPWVRLGVHAIGIDLGDTTIRGPALAAATRTANARIVEFLHDMGIPKALFDASNAVPHESTRFLQRDELAKFELDTREFGETDWRFAEKPNVAIAKGFFVRTGDADLAYPEGLLRLNCGSGKAMRLTFARERPAPTIGTGARPVRITMNGLPIDLPNPTRLGKIEMRTTALWPDAIGSADDKGAIEISGFDVARDGPSPDSKSQDGMSRDRVVLNMAGFSAAYARLRKVCSEMASADNGCSAGELSPRCMPGALRTLLPTPSAANGQATWPAK